MKRIIAGKRYDTATAREVGSDWNGLSSRDFNYLCETLYQKRTGEYFLHGEGGAMSKYAVSCGQNEWSGGEKLMPLTHENARAWVEKHLDADTYEEEFGEVVEDETRKAVTYSLPVSIIEKIARLAAKNGMSRSDIIAEAIDRL